MINIIGIRDTTAEEFKNVKKIWWTCSAIICTDQINWQKNLKAKTQQWVFNIVMLIAFILIVFVPINDEQTLFDMGMDKLLGVQTSKENSQ